MDAKPQGDTLKWLAARLRRAHSRHKNGVSRYFGPTLLISALPRVVICDKALVRFVVKNGRYLSGSARVECVVGADAKWDARVQSVQDGIKVEIVPRKS